MAACLRHLGGSHVGKGTGLDAAAGGRRRGVAGGESAVVLPRKEADSPVSQSVSRLVSALSNTGCIRLQLVAVPAQGEHA